MSGRLVLQYCFHLQVGSAKIRPVCRLVPAGLTSMQVNLYNNCSSTRLPRAKQLRVLINFCLSCIPSFCNVPFLFLSLSLPSTCCDVIVNPLRLRPVNFACDFHFQFLVINFVQYMYVLPIVSRYCMAKFYTRVFQSHTLLLSSSSPLLLL
jgi:hypothetical protein